ncbi:MAG: metalloregulator ArsR/SmtB family transcription factor [Hyphomicrobiaceae bacterium]|nr:metalloregulator ArsR/SmtB family transcription factor [Hyphomicrobiaceae bacterium]
MNDLSPQPVEMSAATLVTALKAAAEPTRLRLLMLLRSGELSVKDLTLILGQSQPRLSRHLKLLSEAGLVERYREGSWVYFHVSDRTAGGRLVRTLLSNMGAGDAQVVRDRERAEALKREREQAAQRYFAAYAGEWDRIRSLHVADEEVEAGLLASLGAGPFGLIVDVGTGTGRVLELVASRADRAIGFDISQAMLAYARSRIERLGLTNTQVRQGNLYALSLPDASADAVVMHQVLHYLSEPQQALAEAARILRPGGRLVVVDFAPHDHEFLREEQAHERLGFATEAVAQWCAEAGLDLVATEALTADALAGAEARPASHLTVMIWTAVCRPAVSAPREPGPAVTESS